MCRLAPLTATIAAAIVLSCAAAHAFDLDDVAQRAEALAAEPYKERQQKVPDWMLVGSMTYDQWRDIRFRPDHALWRDRQLPFQVQFFHPGLYYDRTVRVNVIEPDGVHPVPFDPERFDYGKNTFADRIPRDIGYAGFRIHYPLRNPNYLDELIVFLGASYFRALGRDNLYGLSARGLAIDTVEPSGEEFPVFIEYWLEPPAPDANHVVVYALLDSRSLAGAYRFDIKPGEQTAVDVEAKLYPRRQVAKLGIAPMTSMFFFGENTVRHFDDFRPEVHDSDGLLIHFAGGEWLWRPLDNPTRINTSSFVTTNPKGFGLIQRDREFASYQDVETRAELRPSAWVEPAGDWGEGHIELVEIPTTSELVDNAVAYWVPDKPLQPGSPRSLEYTLYWFSDDRARPPGGRVVATRRDRGTVPGGYRFVVDFNGDRLRDLPADRPPTAVISAGPGPDAADLLDQHVVKNPGTGGWRVSFQLRPKTNAPVELRAFLTEAGDVLSETWSYGLLPEGATGK
ncbi:MAG: glucan biosynthesis protein [Candidatus Binatia bacterium]